MRFLQDKQTLRLILILFGTFLFLFFTISFISHQRFSPGEGLSESVAHEALVQFVVRPTSSAALGVDAHSEHQAVRAAFGGKITEKLIAKNLASEPKAVLFHVEVEPSDLASTVEWQSVWPLTLSLAPGEEKILPLEFRLNKEKFKTQDGVLAVKIFY